MDSPLDDPAEQLRRRVGHRVRRARGAKGFSRRVLSEVSGVSPRYLAQLEGGDGNISIALLQRVAQALDHRIEWLLSDEDPLTSDAARVAALWRKAEPRVQRDVLDLLDRRSPGRAQRICLIGLRGAGKSTLGRAASETLGIPFTELNTRIEAHADMPVPEIMAFYGPEGFRKMEADVLREVADNSERMILAVGGGIVEQTTTFDTLLSRFHAVWIQADPQEHMDRVRAQGDLRPMAGNPEAMAHLRDLLAKRSAAYGRALASVNTSGRTEKQSLSDLLALIEGQGFLSS